MMKNRIAAALPLAAVALAALTLGPGQSASAQDNRAAKPTIVLVHGAWADSSSWNEVIPRLEGDGYKVVAPPNPLRSLAGDAAYVKTFLATVKGPIVLVGHSYGGAVITNAATGNKNIKSLVYVNAFAPDQGESPVQLAGPDSALSADPATIFTFVPATLPPTATTDVYLNRSAVFNSFATGLSDRQKALVLATQRPAAFGGLVEKSGVPAWKTIKSSYLIGTKDKIIPATAQRAMAKRAGSTVIEYDGGHLGLISDARTIAKGIERAAQ